MLVSESVAFFIAMPSVALMNVIALSVLAPKRGDDKSQF